MPNADLNILGNPKRLQAIEVLRLLESSSSPSFDRLSRLAAKLLNTPVALTTIVDDKNQYFIGQLGLKEPEATTRLTPLTHSYCQHVVATNKPLIITDARKHPLVYDNLAIPDLNAISYVGFPLRTPEGITLGTFCVSDTEPRVWTDEELDLLEDLSTLAATEIELRGELIARDTLNERLQFLESLKTEMLRVASHDLRNPLSIIFGYLSLLALDENQFSDTHNSYFHFMKHATEKIHQIVDDIILMQTIEKTDSAPLTDDVNLAELVRMAYSIHLEAATEKNIQFEVKLTTKSTFVTGNSENLQRAINNLVNNALKFTPENGIVLISLYSVENLIYFEVTDTGYGIAPELHSYVFKPFSRVRSKQTADIEGTGLGLYMVKCIIDHHNGHVYFQSEPDEGSTFGFELNSTFVT